MIILTPANLKGFFDARPGRYKSALGTTSVLADGYLPAAYLDYQLTVPGGGSTKPNPVAVAPKVVPPFEIGLLAKSLSVASQTKVSSFVNYGLILSAIASRDATACLLWVQQLQGLSLITAAEASAVTALLTPVADPQWTATVPIGDLEGNFVDGMGQSPQRLCLARNSDGSAVTVNDAAYINKALGRAV